MRRVRPPLCWAVGAVVFICAYPIAYPAGAQRESDIVALTGGRVISSPDALPIDNATVIVQGGRISAIGPAERVTVPAATRVIDCKGLVIVAGFQNSHVHFTEDKWAGARERPASTLAVQLQAMLTGYGFTTVVDTASLLDDTIAIRHRIEAGEVPGPRI